VKLNADSIGRLVLLNTALLGLNTVMLGVLLLRGGGGSSSTGTSAASSSTATTTTRSSTTAPATSATRAAPPAPAAAVDKAAPAATPQSADPFENFILSTVTPLRSAARDHGDDLALPTEPELSACTATGRADSDACEAVLATLRAGYEQYGMPFPSVPEAGAEGGAPSGPGGAAVATAGGGRQVLQLYLDTLQKRLRTAVEAQGGTPDEVLPDPALVAAAVATGDPRSDATAVVLDQLRTQYAAYGLRFTEPYVAGEDAPGAGEAATDAAPAAAAGAAAAPGTPSSADQELLQSYLDHMVHRLERAAKDQGKDPTLLLPAASAVDAAVASGAVDSAQTAAVLATLRDSYAQLDLTFTEPPM